MGYIQDQAIVVSGWKGMKEVHSECVEIANKHGFDGIVSPLCKPQVNGTTTFLIAPDGSKEGWADSDRGDAMRDEIKAFLVGLPERLTWAHWVEVVVGGDSEFAPYISDSPRIREEKNERKGRQAQP